MVELFVIVLRKFIALALLLLGPIWGRIGGSLLGPSDLATQNIQYVIMYSILIILTLYDIRKKKKYFPPLAPICGFYDSPGSLLLGISLNS
jgi:hypothetical protein